LDGRSTFPKRERLQRNYEFRRVYEQGRRQEGKFVVLYVLEDTTAAAATGRRTLGVVTGRKIGNAVARNRARRLLREAYRLNKHKLKSNLQIVMVARAAIRGKRLQEIEICLLDLFRGAGALC